MNSIKAFEKRYFSNYKHFTLPLKARNNIASRNTKRSEELQNRFLARQTIQINQS